MMPLTMPEGWKAQREWALGKWQEAICLSVSEAYDAARRRNLEDLKGADRKMEVWLGESADVYREAGQGVLRRYSLEYGDRFWLAYAREAAMGRTFGHLGVVVACRAATYCFPPLEGLAVVLAVEMKGRGISLMDERFGFWLAMSFRNGNGGRIRNAL